MYSNFFLHKKALFLIATHGSPSLKEPEKWSDTFKNFLGCCLELDPAKRATAGELLDVTTSFYSYYLFDFFEK